MRIGIDCHSIGSGIGGNETYTYHLVRALAAIDRENEYRLYVTQRFDAATPLAVAPNFRLVRLAAHSPYLRVPLLLPLELRANPVDVVHVQYNAPPYGRTPVVNMVHDVASLHYPEFFTRREVWRVRTLLPRSVRRAARVLTVSEYCRQQLMETYGLPPERVTVTHDGVSEHYRPVAGPELAAVLGRYGVSGPYLLSVGNIQPRKNLRGLLDAYAILRREHNVTQRLVIVGRKAWLYSDVFSRVRELGLGEDLLFTGYVPYDDLPALYSGADALVYPSFFEGFGLPPLESMMCGTPVVVSNRPVFPEILGDAAMSVDPYDPADIARGTLAVLRDGALRDALVARGLACAHRYSWETTAERTLAVFRDVHQEGRSPVPSGRSR